MRVMFEDFKFLSEIPLLVTYIRKKNDSKEYVDDNFISLSNLKGVCISNITLPCLLCLGMAGWLWRAKKERDGVQFKMRCEITNQFRKFKEKIQNPHLLDVRSICRRMLFHFSYVQ